MPAPHRRNKGESLAQHIATGTHAAPRHVEDRRDRLKGQQVRDAKKWEAAASDLEQRAAEVRRDYERGVALSRFDRAVREGRAKPPVIVLTPGLPARYYLGACLDCSRELWEHSPRPRVPICRQCRAKR